MRALTANLSAFLRQWQAVQGAKDDADGDAKRPDGWDAGLVRLSGEGVPDQHIALLQGLSLTQLDLLVHTGSPPREPVPDGAEDADSEPDAEPLWIALPGGRFRMGADDISQHEQPVHEVRVPAFEIARDPVTNTQYAAFIAATGHRPAEHWEGGTVPEGKTQHPVVGVSWDDANAYCTWLSEHQPADPQVRLPTEAEWELAARGEIGRDYPWGSEAPDTTRCNFGRQVGDTTPVGSYPEGATSDGVRDLAGNVWEWVADAWADSYQGAPTDGSARQSSKAGAARVFRGGSWDVRAQRCRSAYRSRFHPVNRDDDLGFRCARAQS